MQIIKIALPLSFVVSMVSAAPAQFHRARDVDESTHSLEARWRASGLAAIGATWATALGAMALDAGLNNKREAVERSSVDSLQRRNQADSEEEIISRMVSILARDFQEDESLEKRVGSLSVWMPVIKASGAALAGGIGLGALSRWAGKEAQDSTVEERSLFERSQDDLNEIEARSLLLKTIPWLIPPVTAAAGYFGTKYIGKEAQDAITPESLKRALLLSEHPDLDLLM